MSAAALQGWVQSTDPQSGRVFYANHVTRKTQWEPPPGWVDGVVADSKTQNESSSMRNMGSSNNNKQEPNEEPLPSNWEVMHDPSTGKPFYVDHERKITQWTRPVMSETTATGNNTNSNGNGMRPAVASPPSSGNHYFHSQTNNSNNNTTSHSIRASSTRSYQQKASYYSNYSINSHSHNSTDDVDLSDTMPPLEFRVATVADSLRPTCPQCHAVFASLSKRRHHCRLCGDVFCDACSNRRCTLPLPGVEFEKPVRVCDYCCVDVDRGNFFSMRRYWTVLHLYNPNKNNSNNKNTNSKNTKEEDSGGVATAENVNAALSGLQQDLDQMVSSSEEALAEKVTIPPETLVPEILKHLSAPDTSPRAVRCLAALLSLESIAAASGDSQYAVAVYLYGKSAAMADLMTLLERSGSDRKTLFVQEQATRTLFYLTEAKLVAAVTRKRSELLLSSSNSSNGSDSNNNKNTTEGDSNKKDSLGSVEDSLDIPRAIRNMLDHASATGNPNLQRWAAATLKNLILEDQRRACLAVNEVAARVASGETSGLEPSYTSHLPELVSTGGVMILGSLVGTDDADTRAHAVAALNATLQSTRAVDAALEALSEMTGGEYGRTDPKDGEIVRAIVAAGGCAGSVAQLLLSAESAVAGMGCTFLSTLVKPLLADPAASGTLAQQYEYQNDSSSLGACREAAMEIATGSCLPALLSLVREGKPQRAIELRCFAMETLTATVLSIGEMGRSWAAGQFEEGLERFGAPNKLKEAILMINEEGVMECALQILQSASLGQSLGSSSSQETPASRIRECAGILLSSLTSCSAEAIMELQNRNILSALLVASTDSTMTMASSMRGDGSPRCLGVVETVASLLMFCWQHPSGSEKALLDTLIEMIDSGAIPYISKVINVKIDLDTRDTVVGGLKGRVASCRFLCCLFGLALSDSTGIGMRRLMDAVEADARSYRSNQNPTKDSRRSPSNLIESSLSALQMASNLGRKIMMGGAGANQQGVHFQATVMELVEASLLATGSMCGSSIAPGGSEGTLITGEGYLEGRSDPYVSRRKEICNVACDIVVRGGRGEPSMLPTMMVGGFGEGSVVASLRLALAIAQNGTKEHHTKLAMSGILVPISDLLRSALSRGDIYKFSSSLALVRFCGPYVAAGQGGGLEAVRDAIRVATNVLTLPVNPAATEKQMVTQELLKSECIAALESLSHNASLWSSISTEALPSIIQYISSASTSAERGGHETKQAALRAVLQIVQVPSHAISAAEEGIAIPLGQLLSSVDAASSENDVPMLAMEILRTIAANEQARKRARLMETGLIRSICAAVGKSASDTPTHPTDKRADVTFIGLEIIHLVCEDIEGENPTHQLLQSARATAFLDSVSSEPLFVRSLCATLLLSTKMSIPRHDADSSGESALEILKLYGPPLLYVPQKCAGFDSTHSAAEALLFTVAVYACAIETAKSDEFWNTVQLRNVPDSLDAKACLQTSATLSAHFLSLLSNDHKPFVPKDPRRQEDFLTVARPLVRYRLLEILKNVMMELSSDNTDVYLTSLLVFFNVPRICLSLWRDPALLDLAFELLQHIVSQDPDEVLHLFVEGKPGILSLFDLLNLESGFEGSTNVAEIRRFLSSLLGQLAENGLLKQAVERFDVRSSAIAALTAACLREEERPPDDDDDMTSSKLSSVLMRCLVDLCTVNVKCDGNEVKKIQISSPEATAIATSLGKKICYMVLSRFLERTKLKQYEMNEDENIIDAPDVAMLCALAQHVDALSSLRSIGGLHALSLVAAEGEVSALVALQKACIGNADVLMEGDTYLSLLSLIGSSEYDDTRVLKTHTWRQLEVASFGLLSSLCNGSTDSRGAVAKADAFPSCVSRASDILSSLATVPRSEIAEVGPQVTDDESENEEPNDSLVILPPKQEVVSCETNLPVPSTNDAELGIAACGFLSSLVTYKFTRDSLCSEANSVNCLIRLAESSESRELQLAVVDLLMSLAPYASNDGPLTYSEIGKLSSLLCSDKKSMGSSTLNVNRFHGRVLHGLAIVIDCLTDEVQEGVAEAVASLFLRSAKDCIVSRLTTKEEDRTVAAELSYSLTTTLLLFRGKPFVDKVFNIEMMISLVNLVQWRQDPKTVLSSDEAIVWDASIANCLLLLSMLLWRPEKTLIYAGIDLQTLSGTTLMLARPGKAPRKAIDAFSALIRCAEGTDSASALAAKRVILRLFK